MSGISLNTQQLQLLEALNRAVGDVDGRLPGAIDDLKVALDKAGEHIHTLMPVAAWEPYLGDRFFEVGPRFEYMHEKLDDLSITSASLIGLASLPQRTDANVVEMRRLQILATAGALDLSRPSVVIESPNKQHQLSAMGLLLAFPSETAARVIEWMRENNRLQVARPWSADQSIKEAFDFAVASGGGVTGFMSAWLGLRRTLHFYDTVDFELLSHYVPVRDEAANPVLEIAMRLHESKEPYSPVATLLSGLNDITRLYPARSETSLLIQCASDGKSDSVLALLDAGHSLRSRDNGGKNPITQAIKKGQPEIADMMRAHAARSAARTALEELGLKALGP